MKSNPTLHPGLTLCEDVSNLTGDDLRRLAGLNKSDSFIMVGGPPCQPFSKASYWTDPGNDSRYRRARENGIILDKPKAITKAKKDERRDLIFEYFRLIKESKPDGILFENVPSILHPRNIGTFNKLRKSVEQLGYKTLTLKVDGQDYGIAQKRQRVILLGLKSDMP